MMLATTLPPNGVIEDGTTEERGTQHVSPHPSTPEPVQDILMVRASSPCQDVANAGYN